MTNMWDCSRTMSRRNRAASEAPFEDMAAATQRGGESDMSSPAYKGPLSPPSRLGPTAAHPAISRLVDQDGFESPPCASFGSPSMPPSEASPKEKAENRRRDLRREEKWWAMLEVPHCALGGLPCRTGVVLNPACCCTLLPAWGTQGVLPQDWEGTVKQTSLLSRRVRKGIPDCLRGAA